MTQRILIVGAGIAGLAVALGLHRRGHDVTIVEERRDTSSGAGITLWPNALAALDAIGVGDDVREVGGRVTGGALRWRTGAWLRRPSPQRMVTALGEPLVVVRRAQLMGVLTDALPHRIVEYGFTATNLVATTSGVDVTLSDGTCRRADAVVGADGVGSMVARHLNGTLRRRYAGYTAWRGIAAFGLDPDLSGETVGPGTEFGHVSLGPDLTYWFASERRPEGCPSTAGELAYLRAKYRDWATPIPELLAGTDPADVLRTDLYDRDEARQWARGPVVLVGDAAHPMRPHLGQGGCQAIEDAAALTHCLGPTDDPTTAFLRYVAARQPRVRALVRESKLIGGLVNVRPAFLGGAAMRASALIPEPLLTRHLAAIASRTAFAPPDAT